MTQYGFYFDVTRCTGCKTCVIACKDKHSLPVGRNFRTVTAFETGGWKQDRMTGAWHQNVTHGFVSVSCNHCDDPACVKVCPTKAHAKHADKGGLVLIDREKCIGCGMCAEACPYHAPVLDEAARKMTKCDACADRLAKGQLPVCVESCPQRALDFGYVKDLKAKYGEGAHIEPLPSPALTKPNLIVNHGKVGTVVK